MPWAHAQQRLERTTQLPVENVWLLYGTDAQLTDKWGLHLDGQIRRTRNVSFLRQNQVRVGVNYYLAPQATLAAGYSYLALYSADDAPTAIHAPEHRVYEQLVLQDNEGLVRVQHRYRLEQRRLVRPGESDPVYLNRMRYQLRLTMPLRGTEVKPGTPYATIADELLFNFGRNVVGGIFDQNRASLALGYQFTKATAVEMGYLNQLFPVGDTMQQRHIAQVSLSFNPDLRPATADGAAQR
ncbi:Protein of unknown function [Hymenobacter daecheongensis DSM 21074]|uniref:DUF2490 domain-containing protein n=1 Tax=Hymenobacter daecheongensis DSM 21074 TaxID=1121955 RepID=A0A1M6D1F9_9BACT|nr:DUF2490 domain-containing protein [Hymenobacter daecheongensis]SHI66953.1 Protein of unknown function [Hymenobacter daecheongensis DSM 21074]